MTPDGTLWVGIVGGAILGTVATWVSIAVAIALSRHLARRQPPVAGGYWELDTDTGVWPTLDVDHRRLIEREGKQ